MLLNFKRVVLPLLLAVLCLAAPARGAFHLFVFAEAFTSVDGSVQFIRMHCPNGAAGQNFLAGQTITCTNLDATETHTFTFPSSLNPSGSTSNADMLIATSNFALVPGGITPDFATLPAGFLFPDGGSLQFATFYDFWAYDALPTDGVASLNKVSGVQEQNTPINFSRVHGFVMVPPGVCCSGTDCSVTTHIACPAAVGTWTLDGSCDTNPCAPATGACCAASGSCSVAAASDCTVGGGTPMASGTTCGQNPCPQPQGVCCSGCTCRLDTAANCTGPNTVFNGAPVCNAGSNLTPCCRADYNHSGEKNVGDIFAYLSDWFGQSLRADFVGNGTSTPMVNSIFAFLSAWFAGGC